MQAAAQDVIDVEARELPVGDANTAPDQPAEPIAPVIEQATALARFDPVQAVLADLKKDIAETVYDINTTAGEEAARKLRQRCVKVRTTAKDTYKALNAPLLAVQRGWREKVEAIELAVAPLEKPLDDAINARETEREAEKQRKIEAEMARVAALRAAIADIAKIPAAAVKMSAGELDAQIASLQDLAITEESFGEFLDEAAILRNETVTQLTEMLAAKRLQDEERARLDQQAADQRREQEQAAAERVLRQRIDAIRARAFETIGKNADEISAVLKNHIAVEPLALEFGDMYTEAASTWTSTKTVIEQALDARTTLEAQQAEQKRVADEQAATQQRLQQEAAAQEAERLRLEEAAKPKPTPAPTPEPTPAPTPVPTAAPVALVEDEPAPALSMSMFATSADYHEARAMLISAKVWDSRDGNAVARDILQTLDMCDYLTDDDDQLATVSLLLHPEVQSALRAIQSALIVGESIFANEEIPA